MGTTLTVNFNFVFEFQFVDIINIIGIVVNGFLAVWIVNTIQNNLNNQRVLKDHFIKEINDFKCEYNNFFKKVHMNDVRPQEIIRWFKEMNIKVYDLMNLINNQYGISKDKLRPYQIDLREITTNLSEFNSSFQRNDLISFSHKSILTYEKFRRENNYIFNEIIVELNEAKKTKKIKRVPI